jgi:hypothetical protein
MATKADDGVETVSLDVAESSMPYVNLHRLHQPDGLQFTLRLSSATFVNLLLLPYCLVQVC